MYRDLSSVQGFSCTIDLRGSEFMVSVKKVLPMKVVVHNGL